MHVFGHEFVDDRTPRSPGRTGVFKHAVQVAVIVGRLDTAVNNVLVSRLWPGLWILLQIARPG